MDVLIQWMEANMVGAFSSFLGLIVTTIGFSITIISVLNSKSAAQRAESAAKEALEGVRYFDTIEAISKSITVLEEIQRLNRTDEWKILLDRHTTFRNMITAIKSGNVTLNDEQKSILQSSLQHSSNISHKIEGHLEKNQTPSGIARMNKILSEQTEKLGSLLVEIRNQNYR